jgi:thiol-disulfide isomerase/thioredoxin
MKKNQKGMVVIFCFLVSLLIWASGLPGAQTAGVSAGTEKPAAETHGNSLSIELPIPQEEADKSYLGLSGSGHFTLEQTKARVFLIEIFDLYCPRCQVAAPLVNRLFREIQRRPGIKEQVKIIGIGAGNSPYEVKAFKDKFLVPFPLFPDENKSMAKMLGVAFTPAFIGIRVQAGGSLDRFYLKEGAFQDPSRFLDELLELAGLEKE